MKDKKVEEKKVLTMEEMTQSNEDNTPNFDLGGEGESINDKVSLIAISELLNLNKLKTISRIKFEQVNILTKLYLFNDTFKTPFTKDLADYILQLQISVNGGGRKELVSLVQQRDMTQELNNHQKTTSKNIFK